MVRLASEKLIIRISATGGASVVRESNVAATGLSALGVQSEKVNSAAQAAFDRQRKSARELVTFVKRATLITGTAATAAIGYGVKLNATWQSNEAALATLLGSMQKARDFTEELRTISNKSPLRLTEWQEGAKTLLGYGMNAKKVLPTLNAINKAVVTMGKSEADMRGIVLAIGQIQTKGRVQGQELLQLAERGIPAYAILKEELGLTADQVRNIGKEGIDANKVIDALNTGLEKRYGEGYKRAATTFNFQLASARKGAEQLLRIVSEPVFRALSTTILPAVNEELGTFIKTLDDPKMSGQEKIEKLGQDFDELIDKVGDAAEDALPKFFDTLEDLVPHATAVIRKLTPMVVDLIGEMVKGMVATAGTAGPQVARAFVEGFLESDFLGQLVVGAWLFSKLGGFAALQTAGMGPGTIVAGGFRKGFESGMAAFDLARSFGRGRGAAGAAGMGAMGWQLGSSLLLGLRRALPALAVTYGISETLGAVVSGDTKKGLEKAGGMLAGAGLGAAVGSIFPVVGTGVGAMIGAGIGAGLSDSIAGLFSGKSDPMLTMEQQLALGAKRASRAMQREMTAVNGLNRISKQVERARARERQATAKLRQAERTAAAAKQRYGANSAQSARAEVNLARAKERSYRATKNLQNAERLQGAARKTTQRTLRSSVQIQKEVLNVNQQELRDARKALIQAARGNASQKEREQALDRYNDAAKRVAGAQKQLNKSYEQAARQIGPKFAESLRKMTSGQLQWGRRFLNTKRTVTTGSKDIVQGFRDIGSIGPLQFRKATGGAKKFGEATTNVRKTANKNWRNIAKAQDESTDLIKTDAEDTISELKNLGPVQRRRAGGMIRWVQSFNRGGVPVAVSPGEVFKTPDGRWGRVPGRPTAADNVLTTFPVDTKIFTWDGQRRLAEGASETEALAKQAAHFNEGGIVKPKLSGGTPKAKEIGNKSIDKVHQAAVAVVKKVRNSLGNAPGTLGTIEALGHSMGLRTTSGYRPGDDGYHGSNRARDLSDGYATATELKFAKIVAQRWGARLLELIHTPLGFGIKNGRKVAPYAAAEHYNHVHVAMRKGGILAALQALYTGGQVRVVKNVGRHLLANGFDFRATAGILGNAYREALPPWNPASTGTGGGGLWGFTTSPVSLADLQNYAASKGKSWTDEILQTNFMLKHGGFGLRSKLNAADKISDTARIFMEDWERPGVPALSDRVRGGYEASKILRNAGIVRPGDDDGGMSERERQQATRAATRKRRQKHIQKLMARAMGANSPVAKTGLYWQILDAYAKWGNFNVTKGGVLAGGVTPGGKVSEKQMFLQRVREIASIPNPNRKAGQLYTLAKRLEGRVELNGRENENDRLVRQLEKVRDRGSKRADRKKTRINNNLAKKLDRMLPFRNRVGENEQATEILMEQIELAVREHGADWSELGSEMSEREILTEKDMNNRLWGLLFRRKGMLENYIPAMEGQAARLRQQLKQFRKDPALRWKVPGVKKALDATMSAIGPMRQSLEEVVGKSGQGGALADVEYRLKELGEMKPGGRTGADSERAELLSQQLTDAQKALALRQSGTDVLTGWLEDLRREVPPFAGFFQTGGTVPGPPGAARHAIVHGGEEITPVGESRQPIVNVFVDPVSLDTRVQTIVGDVIRDQVFRANRNVPQGGRSL